MERVSARSCPRQNPQPSGKKDCSNAARPSPSRTVRLTMGQYEQVERRSLVFFLLLEASFDEDGIVVERVERIKRKGTEQWGNLEAHSRRSGGKLGGGSTRRCRRRSFLDRECVA